jgi:hypothetical protein
MSNATKQQRRNQTPPSEATSPSGSNGASESTQRTTYVDFEALRATHQAPTPTPKRDAGSSPPGLTILLELPVAGSDPINSRRHVETHLSPAHATVLRRLLAGCERDDIRDAAGAPLGSWSNYNEALRYLLDSIAKAAIA